VQVRNEKMRPGVTCAREPNLIFAPPPPPNTSERFISGRKKWILLVSRGEYQSLANLWKLRATVKFKSRMRQQNEVCGYGVAPPLNLSWIFDYAGTAVLLFVAQKGECEAILNFQRQ
jgi:hypothetical protein